MQCGVKVKRPKREAPDLENEQVSAGFLLVRSFFSIIYNFESPCIRHKAKAL